MYINYTVKNNSEYATAVTSKREGKSVNKESPIYLGRVVDKEAGIFKHRDKGYITFSLETGEIEPMPADYREPEVRKAPRSDARRNLIVSLGDAYFLDSYIKKTGFDKAIDAIGFKNRDSLYALLCYYMTSDLANCYADDWWELTYAKYLYPNAKLESQRISELLKDLGSEDAKRRFFAEYHRFVGCVTADAKKPHGIDDAILIDSTGLPNAAHIPITATNNHNGAISEEMRLILVTQQKTGMPLFYRLVPGNVTDVTTVTRTIAELKANKIDTKFAIMDAGYYTGANADALYDEGIAFLTRVRGNHVLYKNLVNEHLSALSCRENSILYNNRIVEIACFPCKIGSNKDRDAFAYLCRDTSMAETATKGLIEKAVDEKLTGADVYDEKQEQGVFVLVSSKEIPKEEILPLYYTRDRMEKIFSLCKKCSKILPINVQSETAANGHVLMSFMATALSQMIADTLKGKKYTLEQVFMILHEQHGVVYDDQIITGEPTHKMNELYKIFGIDCPVSIPLPAQDVEVKQIGN